MTEIVKQHAPAIAAVTLVGLSAMFFLLMRVVGDAANLDFETFMSYTFTIPCVVIFLCSTVVALTSPGINRQLYVVIVVIGMLMGAASMIACNTWLVDPSISSELVSNSPEGTVVTSLLNLPVIVLRDIAAFFVIPTVGSILGAWLGSRLHPMSAERASGKRKSKKKAKK